MFLYCLPSLCLSHCYVSLFFSLYYCISPCVWPALPYWFYPHLPSSVLRPHLGPPVGKCGDVFLSRWGECCPLQEDWVFVLFSVQVASSSSSPPLFLISLYYAVVSANDSFFLYRPFIWCLYMHLVCLLFCFYLLILRKMPHGVGLMCIEPRVSVAMTSYHCEDL